MRVGRFGVFGLWAFVVGRFCLLAAVEAMGAVLQKGSFVSRIVGFGFGCGFCCFVA